MDNRIFYLNNEPCIIHYPTKPNGFGVLLIGDGKQYVRSDGSSWLNNEGRSKILEQLISEGYTIFYTNSIEDHMGNKKAVEQVKNLYEYIKRTEILNEKIHVIVEGEGALITNTFILDKSEAIRSLLYINPLFSLSWLTEMVREQPFLYKRKLKLISKAFGIHEKECDKFIKNQQRKNIHISQPFTIIHILEHGVKDEKWISFYKKYLYDKLDKIHVLLPEKRYKIGNYAVKLFRSAENQL